MYDEASFQEMMQRYSRELLMMQKKTRAAASGPEKQERRSAQAAPGAAAAPLDMDKLPPPPAAQPDTVSQPDAAPAPADKGHVPAPAAARDTGADESGHTAAPALRMLPCTLQKERRHSLTVGPDGPVLLQDTDLHETLESFVHQKPLERAVHVKGYGALGHFQPYQSMEEYTTARFLQSMVKTPVLTRFSLAAGNRGTPDTARNIRGFATKFYTEDGIFDLVGNHIPVFFIRDAIKFPQVIAALSPSPVNNLAQPAKIWEFVARNPEAVHMLTWLYSDVGTVRSFRNMRGYGVNTYVWKNAQGVRRYVKYHWIPLAGEQYLDAKEAQRLAGENPDIAGQDLYDTLYQGENVEFELCVQLMELQDAQRLPYDPLDDTKVWSEEDYPLFKVGRLTLNRNPQDYRTQVEQAAFSPANLVQGIELSADKMLQGRSFIYWDAQRRRLGPDFRALPVNHIPGRMTEMSIVQSGEGVPLCGDAVRSDITKPDDFTQAGQRYLSLSETGRAHLIDNIAAALCDAREEALSCVLQYLYNANPDFAARVAQRMERMGAGR